RMFPSAALFAGDTSAVQFVRDVPKGPGIAPQLPHQGDCLLFGWIGDQLLTIGSQVEAVSDLAAPFTVLDFELQGIAGPFADGFPFPWCDRQQDVQDQATGSGPGVDAVGNRE